MVTSDTSWTLSRFALLLCAAALISACGDDGNSGSDASDDSGEDAGDIVETQPLQVSGVNAAAGCETVNLTLANGGDYDRIEWAVDGVPLLYIDGDVTGASLRVPAYHSAYTLTVTANGFEGEEVASTDAFEVSVAATETPEGEIPGTMPACGSFAGGVASGDPGTNYSYIWTRWYPQSDVASETISYEVATDAALTNVVASGDVVVSSEADFTTVTEVSGLEPGTDYFFRFTDSAGDVSELGRTRTLPGEDADEFQIAVVSCSSLFSGYFNAYARMAERDDIDLVVHLGDLVYDFVDGEERIRLPDEDVINPANVEEWRQRFKEYIADPDQRRARQVHPWFPVWDNHDSDVASDGAEVAFREYVPMAPANPSNPDGIYRALDVGDLVDVILLDALREREDDGETRSILGAEQNAWLENRLANSQAAWHVYGTQKLVSELAVPDVGIGSPTPWNDYTESRDAFYRLLADNGDNLVVSGDFHTPVANNMYLDAEGRATTEAEGSTRVGVEFLPSSISRGNFDETICGGLCEDAVLQAVLDGVRDALLDLNPHNAYLQLTEHGYGLLDITRERITAEFWFSKIREITTEEVLAQTLVTEPGVNEWMGVDEE